MTHIYMAKIFGWTEVSAFSFKSEADAKKKALAEKKRLCKDDLEKWTWDSVEEYYGASVTEITDGLVVLN